MNPAILKTVTINNSGYDVLRATSTHEDLSDTPKSDRQALVPVPFPLFVESGEGQRIQKK